MADRHQQKPYPLRMPDELRVDLEEAAEHGGRSLHAEILRRLDDSFANDFPEITDLEAVPIPEILERQRLLIDKHAAEMNYLTAYLTTKLVRTEISNRAKARKG